MIKKFFFFLCLFFVACSSEEKTVIQYMPHMANTPVLKAQRGYKDHDSGTSMLLPPDGTIPRGYKPYRIKDPAEAGRKLTNPLPINQNVLFRGQERYTIYCGVCHGARGYGDGPVVPPFPTPKSLQSKVLREQKDGYIFHIITKGQGTMPAYNVQIPEEDRWAIVHYLRALQRAEHPTSDDLRAYEEQKGEIK